MSPIRRRTESEDPAPPPAPTPATGTTAAVPGTTEGAGPTPQREMLGRVLVARGAVTASQVNAASRAQKKGDPRRIGEILVEQGLIDEAALAGGLAAQAGLPVINLEESVPSERALAKIDGEVAREHRVVPVRLSRSGLIVAVEHVPTAQTMRMLTEVAETKIGIGIATASQIDRALAQAYGGEAAAAPASASTGSSGHQPRRRLGELLLERDLLSAEDLQRALQLQTTSGQRLGEELIGLGILDERSLVRALSDQLGLPLVDLRNTKPDPAALEAIPETLARGLTVVPMAIHPHGLDVVVADPDQVGMVDELTRAAGRPIRLMMAPTSEVKRAIDQSYRALAGVEQHVREFSLSAPAATEAQAVLQRAVDQDAPVVQVVNLIITQALRDRASDIHIEPQGDNVRIRMRTDGALHEVLTLPPEMGPAVVSRIKVMADMNIVERRRAQDGQIEMNVDGRALDIRVATSPVIFGEKVALRLLDKSRSLYKLGDLGMGAETDKLFSDLVRSPFGMMLCAGPTGSGKTTTLYATLAEIDTAERNVMTIEDPVEYVMPSVNQIQINEMADITFADGLKSILRQDPDVILVGEIRDVETARIAVQSALTGHFVLSSLHATDAASAVHRLLDMGIEPFLIAPAVLAVTGQRLVRRICPECKVPYQPASDELSFYTSIGGPEKDEFFHGEGCNFCSGTGYQERIGVYEVLRMTDAMRQLIVSEPSHGAMRELAIEEGMRPLRAEALRLVAEDVTTIAEILRSVYPL
jgi:type IV pilus assembly protein PilB